LKIATTDWRIVQLSDDGIKQTNKNPQQQKNKTKKKKRGRYTGKRVVWQRRDVRRLTERVAAAIATAAGERCGA